MPRKTQTNDAALARYQDYQATFKTPSGKRVLLDLMERFHVIKPMGIDTNEILIREGERRVVLNILTMLQIDVTKIKEMLDADRDET